MRKKSTGKYSATNGSFGSSWPCGSGKIGTDLEGLLPRRILSDQNVLMIVKEALNEAKTLQIEVHEMYRKWHEISTSGLFYVAILHK
jgi:hypothetical protein